MIREIIYYFIYLFGMALAMMFIAQTMIWNDNRRNKKEDELSTLHQAYKNLKDQLKDTNELLDFHLMFSRKLIYLSCNYDISIYKSRLRELMEENYNWWEHISQTKQQGWSQFSIRQLTRETVAYEEWVGKQLIKDKKIGLIVRQKEWMI